MKYESLLIITYGRSGSTLLQGLLNTIDGCEVRGENYNFCYGLFQAYRSLMGTRKRAGHRVTSPWYGPGWDEKLFLRDARRLVRHQLIGPRGGASHGTCYGFKEIRYADLAPEELEEYLGFLTLMFPRPALVFNTRKLEDVVRSDWWRRDPEGSLKALSQTDAAFRRYAAHREHCFLIDYHDVVEKTPALRLLFAFLGAPYAEEAVDRVLGTPHSYRSKPAAERKPYAEWGRDWPPS
ncbi:hypothetical protein B7P34_05745 [Streptosporangium nondiastaticum]|uniref:Sulfotransferase n=1 Tax=Streptosporangium nondiastaticum TaxID=35764 RepID=A0A9X7PJ40_9ACTN|nr:sulfotransferase [Streptosporangium nondiastaticum]PSJ29753.1 hypothetical protein B7P34_05745 [Streptosporangium nondiastaticum]